MKLFIVTNIQFRLQHAYLFIAPLFHLLLLGSVLLFLLHLLGFGGRLLIRLLILGLLLLILPVDIRCRLGVGT